MRAAAKLLLVEAEAIRPILDSAPVDDFDRPTVCAGWSVRDVLAHCGAALTRVAIGDVHGFTPQDNEADVELRRSWTLDEVLAELYDGYNTSARAIDEAGGRLDGVGLGEWVHGGDVREGLGVGSPYTSEGIEMALELMLERSRFLERPPVAVTIDKQAVQFGPGAGSLAALTTDLETFMRLCGGRRPDPARYVMHDCEPTDFVLFT